MHYAAQHPDVRALVLIDPGRLASHIEVAVERMAELAAKSREGIERVRDSTIANNVAIGSSDLLKTVVRQIISSQDPEGYAATCEALCAETHAYPNYAATKCATVLIIGDQERISPLLRSDDMRKLIRGGDKDQIVRVEIVN